MAANSADSASAVAKAEASSAGASSAQTSPAGGASSAAGGGLGSLAALPPSLLEYMLYATGVVEARDVLALAYGTVGSRPVLASASRDGLVHVLDASKAPVLEQAAAEVEALGGADPPKFD